MALINVTSALPAHTWAVVRLLASAPDRAMALDRARALLSPRSLQNAGGSPDRTFDSALGTLRELGLITVDKDAGAVRLTEACAAVDGTSWDDYVMALRAAVLSPGLNTGLDLTGDQSGPRDLSRALAWFLSLDPMQRAVTKESFPSLQRDALRPETGPAVINAERWNLFGFWAPALGLAAAPLMPQQSGGTPLVPDCTTAVRQIFLSNWDAGRQVDAIEAVHTLREALPVLPGGRLSRAVGIADVGDAAGHALSFALLRGQDEGWLKLERVSDPVRVLQISDPDQPSSPRYVSELVILENPRV